MNNNPNITQYDFQFPLEAVTDWRFIQELFGHKSSRTTEIYTYVSIMSLKNIKNPFNNFDIYKQNMNLHNSFSTVDSDNVNRQTSYM